MADNPNSNDRLDAAKSEDSINLREYLPVIIRRRRQILGIWGFIVAACIVYCFAATPIYQAESVIIIDKEDTGRGGLQDAMTMMPMMAMLGNTMGNEYAETQCDVLESRSVAYDVMRRLSLGENKDFYEKNGFFSWLRLGEDDDATLKYKMLKEFWDNLKVEKVLRTQCIKISYASKNPALAADIANTLVEAYREHSFAMKIDSIRDSADWLKNNLEQERQKLEVAEQALLAYQEKNDILLDFSKDTEKTNMAMKKMEELSVLLVKAGSERAESETCYRQAASVADRPDRLDSVPEIQQSELITKIKVMEAELLRDRSELSKRYGPLHPQMVAVQSELKTMQAKKEQEIQRVISALENAYQGKLAKEKTIQDELNAHKADFFKIGKNATEITRLYVEATGARIMYTVLLKRLKETEVTENLKVGNVRVVDKAEPPVKPVKPRKVLYTCLAILVGFFAAIGAALSLEYLRPQLPGLVKLYQKER